jgi:MSHA biogenesis protein MshG
MGRAIKIIEKDIANQKKIKGALRYPALVFFALTIAFFAVITMIIPKFAVIYSSFKVDLPLPTQILIGINVVIRQFWLFIILAAGGIYYAFRKVLESPAGKLSIDRFILSIPVSGMLVTKIILSRFSRMFSAMLASGITVVEALTISSRTAGNEVFKKVILTLRDDVVKGESLSNAMRESNMFPSVAIQMVAVGEKAGNIEEMLDHVADYFEKETDYVAENLSSMIEPILVLVMGLLVLLLALGVYLPIWNMMQLFGQ